MRIIFIMLLMLLGQSAYAFKSLSLGSIADNMTEPMEIVSAFVSVGCLIVGVACIFASLVKYFEHRRSPLHVPLSTVIWLLIIGLALLALPFAYLVTGNGIPFAILWGGATQ
jgi:hypothetical protein